MYRNEDIETTVDKICKRLTKLENLKQTKQKPTKPPEHNDVKISRIWTRLLLVSVISLFSLIGFVRTYVPNCVEYCGEQGVRSATGGCCGSSAEPSCVCNP